MFTTGIYVVLSVLAVGPLINAIVPELKYMTLSNPRITLNDNDYISDFTMGLIDRKNKNTLVTCNFTAKDSWPDNIQFSVSAKFADDAAIEYAVSVCDGLDDGDLGPTVSDAGLPKDEFPKECPFKKGDWSIFKYDPPTAGRALPRGKFDGIINFLDGDNVVLVEVKLDGNIQNVPKKV